MTPLPHDMNNAPDPDFLRAKRNNNRAGLAIFAIFLVWLPTNLLVVRPAMNRWLAPHIQSYPAVVHVTAIFGGLAIVGWPLAKLHSPPPPRGGPSDAR
jgi:hypothetical protein